MNLRAVRRKLQRVAQRTQAHEDWAFYKKVDAAFLSHTLRLRLVQWQQLWEFRDARLPAPRAWRMTQPIPHLPVARQTAASFAIQVGITRPLAVERMADEFSYAVQSPGISRHDRCSDAPLRSTICADEPVTLAELKYVLKYCRQRAPGLDEATNQAPRNLGDEFYPLLLES